MAKKPKRMGKEDAPARIALLKAAETLLQREGYPSLVGRRVAEEAGVTRELLYYYFSEIDELIVEVFDRYATDFIERIDAAFLQEDPVRALWTLYTDGNARLFMEFMALSSQNEMLRDRFTKAARQQEEIQKYGIRRLFEANDIDPTVMSADVASFLFESAVRNYLIGNEIGFFTCGLELDGFIDRLSRRIGPITAKPAPKQEPE